MRAHHRQCRFLIRRRRFREPNVRSWDSDLYWDSLPAGLASRQHVRLCSTKMLPRASRKRPGWTKPRVMAIAMVRRRSDAGLPDCDPPDAPSRGGGRHHEFCFGCLRNAAGSCFPETCNTAGEPGRPRRPATASHRRPATRATASVFILRPAPSKPQRVGQSKWVLLRQPRLFSAHLRCFDRARLKIAEAK